MDNTIEIYFCTGFLTNHELHMVCFYLDSVSGSGIIYVKLVTAMSRVVPMKKFYSIPRLELLGNLILLKFMNR